MDALPSLHQWALNMPGITPAQAYRRFHAGELVYTADDPRRGQPVPAFQDEHGRIYVDEGSDAAGGSERATALLAAIGARVLGGALEREGYRFADRPPEAPEIAVDDLHAADVHAVAAALRREGYRFTARTDGDYEGHTHNTQTHPDHGE